MDSDCHTQLTLESLKVDRNLLNIQFKSSSSNFPGKRGKPIKLYVLYAIFDSGNKYPICKNALKSTIAYLIDLLENNLAYYDDELTPYASLNMDGKILTEQNIIREYRLQCDGWDYKAH